MRLTKVTAKMRKAERLGAAVAYALELDTMGGSVGPDGATVYLGRSQVVDLVDEIASVAGTERETIAEQLMADLMATYERLVGEYADLGEVGPEELKPADQELVHWGDARGRAQGLAFALAVLRNPNAPDYEGMREEVADRWFAVERKSAGS